MLWSISWQKGGKTRTLRLSASQRGEVSRLGIWQDDEQPPYQRNISYPMNIPYAQISIIAGHFKLTALQSPSVAHSCVAAWLFMTMPSLTNVAPPLVDRGNIPSVTAKRKIDVSFSPAHPMEWLVHSCEYYQNTALSTFRIIIGPKIRPATNSAWLTVPHAFPTFDDRAAQAAQNQATKITFVLPRVEEQVSSVQEIQWYIPLHCWIRGILLVAPYSSLRNWVVQYKSQTLISSKSPVWR